MENLQNFRRNETYERVRAENQIAWLEDSIDQDQKSLFHSHGKESSLETNLTISLNEKLFKITEKTNFAELCITSDAKIEKTESDETTVITTKAEGEKCSVCWKISKNGCERHPV